MTKSKRGKGASRKDLWNTAGGKELIENFFLAENILHADTTHNSQIWHRLANSIFGENTPKNRQWLFIIWTYNRRNIRTALEEKTNKDENKPQTQIKPTINLNKEVVEGGEEGAFILKECGQTESESFQVTENIAEMPSSESHYHLQLTTQNKKNRANRNTTGEKSFRDVPQTPTKFKMLLHPTVWRKIKPLKGSKKLKLPWTHYIYKEFQKKNPCCPLRFTYQHVRSVRSRKRFCAYLSVRARCVFPSCCARYSFTLQTKPSKHQAVIPVTVCRTGQILHQKLDKRFRPASNVRRGRIAKGVLRGVSTEYYDRLKNTPVEELLAGNITHSLNKNILKVISHEIKKSIQLHDNILLETQLTQSIIRECDTASYCTPGYVQHFQVDPFGAHLYTETGISILVNKLKQKSPVALYLDATGSVISQIPQKKKTSYTTH